MNRGALLGVSALLLLAGGVALWPQVEAGWRGLAALEPATGIAVAAGLFASHGLRACRLQAEWRERCRLGLTQSLRVTLTHSATVNLMPMRLGELGYPVLMHRGWRVPLGEAASSLLWMRLQDAMVLGWIAALTVAALASAQLGVGAAGGAAMLWLAAIGRLHPLCRQWQRRLQSADRGARNGLRGLLDRALSAALRGSAGAREETWFWCCCNWLVKLGTLALLLGALTGLGHAPAWSGALGGELAASLPVQPPAGFGTYEAGAAWGAALVSGAPMPALLAAALVMHLAVLATSLVGTAVLACWPAARSAG